ncbi:hypothetical protein Pla108_38540 [Botrimarina colliarenosi]|uniref:Uncharacterized protein n=1 Tax=Botrimarina colliarenosi TaxID=2528001 RepID=A0A5C6A506_9BACT|nr:hypothetical protein [Botrimarina colliarenosi]TWT94141.1 hypothetical protein Pla108_38540 [Botrimarina colliarenosi]
MILPIARQSLALSCLTLTLVFGEPLVATAGLYSQAVLIVGDQFTGSGIEFAESETAIPMPLEVSGSTSYEVSTLGGEGDLTFQGSATALANYSFLRTSAEGEVSNTYYDPDYHHDNGTGDVPTRYTVQSIARFEDTLAYGGTAVGYNSKYIFRVTGNISDSNAYASIELTHGMALPQRWFFSEPGPIDVTIVSNSFVGAPNQLFSLELVTSFDAETEFMGDGGFASGYAQFGNTVELLGIEARDDSGMLLATSDFTSVSGTTYEIIAAIPEPTSLAIGLLGVCMFFGRRFR